MIDILIKIYKAKFYGNITTRLRESFLWSPFTFFLLLLCLTGVFVVKDANTQKTLFFLIILSSWIFVTFASAVKDKKEDLNSWISNMHKNTDQRKPSCLKRKIDRAKDVKRFIEETIPEIRLSKMAQVDELIKQLDQHIEQSDIYKNVWMFVQKFLVAVVVPVLTFIFGVYQDNIRQLDPVVVLQYGVLMIAFSGCICVVIDVLLEIARIIDSRNYHAAVALRSDLLAIKLLNFPEQSAQSFSTPHNNADDSDYT